MNYIQETEFRNLFSDRAGNHDAICLSLNLIAHQIARHYTWRQSADRDDRTTAALVSMIAAIDRYKPATGPALLYFSVVGQNQFRQELRRAYLRNERNNLDLDHCDPSKRYQRLVDVLPQNRISCTTNK